MPTKYIALIGTAGLLFIALLVYVLLPKGATQVAPGQSFPESISYGTLTAIETSVGKVIPLLARDGGTVVVRAFTDTLEPTISEGGDIVISESEDFRIAYYVPQNTFSIILHREPLHDMRRAAEAVLLSSLGITQEELCRLYVFVSMPTSVNETYAGVNIGVSFCPGATLLQ